MKSNAILGRATHPDSAPRAVPEPRGGRAGSPFHLMQEGAASRNSSAGSGPGPRACVAPTRPGLPSWPPSRLPSRPQHIASPAEGASAAGALRAQALRAAPAPCRARRGGRPSPPPAPAGPRSPLSPPASASSSARALGAAATSPQVRPAAEGRCDPAERGPRGAGAPRTGSVGSSGSPAALA